MTQESAPGEGFPDTEPPKNLAEFLEAQERFLKKAEEERLRLVDEKTKDSPAGEDRVKIEAEIDQQYTNGQPNWEEIRERGLIMVSPRDSATAKAPIIGLESPDSETLMAFDWAARVTTANYSGTPQSNSGNFKGWEILGRNQPSWIKLVRSTFNEMKKINEDLHPPASPKPTPPK